MRYIILGDKKIDPNIFQIVYQDKYVSIVENVSACSKVFYVHNEACDSVGIQIQEDRGDKIAVRTSFERPEVIVVSDIVYPGWSVKVDNKNTTLLNYRNIFKSVLVPEGDHKVEFIYAPDSFRVGIFLTVASIIFYFLILFSAGAKSRG